MKKIEIKPMGKDQHWYHGLGLTNEEYHELIFKSVKPFIRMMKDVVVNEVGGRELIVKFAQDIANDQREFAFLLVHFTTKWKELSSGINTIDSLLLAAGMKAVDDDPDALDEAVKRASKETENLDPVKGERK